MAETWCVYVLRCPDSMEVRYVGVTRRPKKLLGQHIREGRAGRTRRCNWLRSLEVNGKTPVFEVVEAGVQDWDEAERRWVRKFKEAGADLVNGNEGGNCMTHVREKVGNWKAYTKVMRRLGVMAHSWRRDGRADLARKLESAQKALRDAAKKLKAEGRMQELEDRLSKSIGLNGCDR